jgi:hypothetical protein
MAVIAPVSMSNVTVEIRRTRFIATTLSPFLKSQQQQSFLPNVPESLSKSSYGAAPFQRDLIMT